MPLHGLFHQFTMKPAPHEARCRCRELRVHLFRERPVRDLPPTLKRNIAISFCPLGNHVEATGSKRRPQVSAMVGSTVGRFGPGRDVLHAPHVAAAQRQESHPHAEKSQERWWRLGDWPGSSACVGVPGQIVVRMWQRCSSQALGPMFAPARSNTANWRCVTNVTGLLQQRL